MRGGLARAAKSGKTVEENTKAAARYPLTYLARSRGLHPERRRGAAEAAAGQAPDSASALDL